MSETASSSVVSDIFEAGGVIVNVIAAIVLEGGNPNTFIGRVVSIDTELPRPFIRLILTQSFGPIPIGTLVSIDVTDIAAFGPIVENSNG